jgi:hypothetical protein
MAAKTHLLTGAAALTRTGATLEEHVNRRGILRSAFIATAAALGVSRFAAPAGAQTRHIRLYVEMDVPPGREREMLQTLSRHVRSRSVKHDGYIRVKMLKRRSILQGTAPAAHNYRFELEFESEELRQKVDRVGRTPAGVAARRADHDDAEGLPGRALRRGLTRTLSSRARR